MTWTLKSHHGTILKTFVIVVDVLSVTYHFFFLVLNVSRSCSIRFKMKLQWDGTELKPFYGYSLQ